MNQGLCFLSGLGAGAGLMYWMDPIAGRRRRAMLRDQMVSAASGWDDCLAKTWTDVRQRGQGLAAEISGMFTRDDAPDQVVAQRVRSILGRCVSHPGAIEVIAEQGQVTLTGPVLAHEVDDLLCAASSVRGVTGVRNQLDVHKEAGDLSALQGGRPRSGQQPFNILEENWAPATRALAGVAGGALVALGLTQRFPTACVLGTLGLGLMGRAATNLPLPRMLGLSDSRRGLTVQKTITINVPCEEVFDFWANYENFPRFMAHLQEVKNLGTGRSRWTAIGPAGIPVSWTAIETQFIRDEIIAWKSEPGSLIANAGIIRFETEEPGVTRLTIRLSYNPPAGALGHFAARLFGADPKSAIDEDLVRLKSLLEAGKTRAPGKQATHEELSLVGQAME